ncbi:MAG: hypothetical protein NTZ09_02245 [Candidatus Hydrogenedentes bacterium]|nr:hypothetical protein [Candidatus Hydrogenedentota bacterium]
MKHLRPLSKAIIGTPNGILSLLQLLINLGILNIQDIFKKDGDGV